MTRRSPQVEALEREIAILRRIDAERRKDPGDLPVMGCGDNSCVVAQPSGMATNGGCRCEPREVRRAMVYWKRRAQFLDETIQSMKRDCAQGDDWLRAKLTAVELLANQWWHHGDEVDALYAEKLRSALAAAPTEKGEG